jgi:hypothetical protein
MPVALGLVEGSDALLKGVELGLFDFGHSAGQLSSAYVEGRLRCLEGSSLKEEGEQSGEATKLGDR